MVVKILGHQGTGEFKTQRYVSMSLHLDLHGFIIPPFSGESPCCEVAMWNAELVSDSVGKDRRIVDGLGVGCERNG